jgi:hypothetical protein
MKQQWGRYYRYGPETEGYYVPDQCLTEAEANVERKRAKRLQAKIRRDQREQERRQQLVEREKLALRAAFDRVYPSIPEDVRDDIISFMGDKAMKSGIVSGSSDSEMNERVIHDAYYWVLHNMTGYDEEFKMRKDEIYAKTIGSSMGVLDRKRAYDMIYYRKDMAIEELRNECYEEAVEITEQWKQHP